MKNDKITIYTMPLGQKIFGAITLGICILFFSLPLLLPGSKINWQGILALTCLDILLAYLIFLSFFRRVVFDGERGVLKLCDFWVRSIPLQDIKVVERGDSIYGGGSRSAPYCYIYIELINGKKKETALTVPRGAKRKSWLEHIDQEITNLNERIDNWYMEYRKQNKKR